MSRELLNGIESLTSSTANTVVIEKDSTKITGNSWVTDGQSYIEINPNGGVFYYDIVFSNSIDGNLFYIGFERYNASKETGSNSSCVYVVSSSAASDMHRVNGSVTLTGTINDSPITYLRLRILNRWSGSTADASQSTLEIKQLSLIQAEDMSTDIKKNGIVSSGHFRENHLKTSSIFKNEGFEANQFIEI